ncbi:redoxin domain-containing protein [Miniimonas arenae]|uniref:redoxin domain-containing protein n=1 Tax=Miniimonas arenae TaxID=676201 RepID=UPI0028B0ED04|nr:redoxin domain-containing protein [Miniimonas arenae]
MTRAPSFTLALPYGAALTERDLRGRPALLLFVPGAFTPVCTREVVAHAAAFGAPASATSPSPAPPVRLVVVSCDSPATLAAWRTALEFSDGVDLASDFWPHGSVTTAFGAFDEARGTPRRRTVLLDGAGAVRWTTTSPGGVERDVAEAQRAVAALAG